MSFRPPCFFIAQVVVYLRWARWLLHHTRVRHDVVIVNMDETLLSNQTQWRHGWHFRGRHAGGLTADVAPRESRDRRTTCVAALCDQPLFQRVLPQIVIQQSKAQSESGRAHQSAAVANGPPDVWTNSTGMMDARCLRRFVVRLRCEINKVNAVTWILLVLDCSPLHLSTKFLRFCSQLGVLLLFVPALTTWFLQPLDVYVFSTLKRMLSAKLHAGHSAQTGRVLNARERFHVQVASARETMQAGRWERALSRCGVTTDMACMRPPLVDMVLGADLKARPPTCQELAELLGRPVAQADRMLPLLLGWPQRLRDSSFVMRPPGWCLPRVRRTEDEQTEQHRGSASSDALVPGQPSQHAGPIPRGQRLWRPPLAGIGDTPPPPTPGPVTGRRSLHPFLAAGVLRQPPQKKRRL